jgi:simple sugar transport system substrate-binding protein
VIFTGDWSMPVKEAEATNSLADQGIDVFTMHVDGPKVVVETAAKRGKMVCGYHASQAKLAPKAYLTGAEWNWDDGLQDPSILTPHEGRQAAPQLRARRAEGRLREDVALRPGRDRRCQEKRRRHQGQDDRRQLRHLQGAAEGQQGQHVVAAGKTLKQTDLELEKMNYLVEGVVGVHLTTPRHPRLRGA